jgi:GcrA cell cycle regulator
MSNYWAKEDIEKVKEYWEKGMSAGMIARMFPNKTRNSVIGIVHRNRQRLQISSRATMVSKPHVIKPKTEKPRRVASISVNAQKLNNKFKAYEAKIRKEAEPSQESYSPGNKTIFDLRAFDCRAVIGPVDEERTVYCGAIVMAGTSWCKHHFDLYTIKQEKKNGFVSKASKRDAFGSFQFRDHR